MAEISVTANIVIPNGPKLSFNRILETEAFDKIDVAVPVSTTTPKEVELQPGGAGQVQFIAIVSDFYDQALSYTVNAPSPPVRKLDQPHLLTGQGAVSMFAAAAPTKLFFSNATTGPAAKDANVQILIGRDATP